MRERKYDRNRVVEYAEKWAYSRNPKYYNFDLKKLKEADPDAWSLFLHGAGYSSSSTIINDEIVYTNTKTFEIRFYQPIDNEDIIEWYSDKYRIVSITPDRKNQRKVLTVEKIVE